LNVLGAERKERDRSWILLHLGVSLIILFRALPYLFYNHENIITDEASFGLMAKHLAEGREFPVLFYGQNYPFVLSSWTAAPLFWLFGPTATMLRLPLLICNLFTGNALVRLLRSESGLTMKWAFICSLWFLLPSVMSSNDWMDASKMSETFVFILLLWIFRKKPLLSGLISGIGAMQRPFMFYGLVALVFLEWRAEGVRKAAFFRTEVTRFLGLLISYLFIRGIAVYGTNYYPYGVHVHLKHLRFILEDIRGFFAELVTRTIGVKIQDIPRPPIGMMQSRFDLLGWVLFVLELFLLAWFVRILWVKRREIWKRTADPSLRFAFYLAITGLVCFGGYVVLSPPDPHIHYVQLLVFGLVGIYALQQKLGNDRSSLVLSLLFLFGCMANNLFANARAWVDLARLEQDHPTANLIQYLKQHDIRAGVGEFGSNHNITFNTGEQIVIADSLTTATPESPGSRFPQEIPIIFNTPERNRARITLSPCPEGVHVEVWYVCPFSGPAFTSKTN
jgi:hypothetical protein